MLSNGITTVLFDLDGTLLPMNEEVFTKAYFKLLAKTAAPYGYESPQLIEAVWAGTKAMMKNDGSQKNRDRFWQVFSEKLGPQVLDLEPVFDAFYREEFDRVQAATRPNHYAKRVVHRLKEQGYTLVLATNPLFPRDGVITRMAWVGLVPQDFDEITSYENSSYCKPNLGYYREILEKIGKKPQECLMVGNDAVEDLAAAELGIEIYLVNDCLVAPNKEVLLGVQRSSFAQLAQHLLETGDEDL